MTGVKNLLSLKAVHIFTYLGCFRTVFSLIIAGKSDDDDYYYYYKFVVM